MFPQNLGGSKGGSNTSSSGSDNLIKSNKSQANTNLFQAESGQAKQSDQWSSVSFANKAKNVATLDYQLSNRILRFKTFLEQAKKDVSLAVLDLTRQLDSPQPTQGEFRKPEKKLAIVTHLLVWLTENHNDLAAYSLLIRPLEELVVAYQEEQAKAQSKSPQREGLRQLRRVNEQQTPEQIIAAWALQGPRKERELRLKVINQISECIKQGVADLTLDMSCPQEFQTMQDLLEDSIPIKVTDLPPFAQFKLGHLKKLSIKFHSIQTLSTESLLGLASLTEFAIEVGPLSYIAEHALSPMKNLTSLSLASNKLNQINPNAFKPLGNTLKALNLESNDLSAQACAFLAPLTSITSLNLFNNQLGEVPKLDHLTGLVDLNLSFCELTDIAAGSFTNNARLKSLNLSGNEIEHFAPEALSNAISGLEVNLDADNLVNYPQLIAPLQSEFSSAQLKFLFNGDSPGGSSMVSEALDTTSTPTASSSTEKSEVNSSALELQIANVFSLADLTDQHPVVPWHELPNVESFSLFLQRFEEVIGVYLSDVDANIIETYQDLAAILKAMSTNLELAARCCVIANDIRASCSDGLIFAFIQMQIEVKAASTDSGLLGLLLRQVNIDALTIINRHATENFKQQKIRLKRRDRDEIETYLCYYLKLQKYLGVKIPAMRYQADSNVAASDIVNAEAEVKKALSLDNVFQSLIYDERVKSQFAQQFHDLEYLDEFDSNQLVTETAAEYLLRLAKIESELKQAKVKQLAPAIEKEFTEHVQALFSQALKLADLSESSLAEYISQKYQQEQFSLKDEDFIVNLTEQITEELHQQFDVIYQEFAAKYAEHYSHQLDLAAYFEQIWLKQQATFFTKYNKTAIHSQLSQIKDAEQLQKMNATE